MENTIKIFTRKREEFLKLKLHEAIDWEKYNLILIYHGQSPAIIHKEDRQEYITSLLMSREIESSGPVKKFLYEQQIREFERQIEKQQSNNRGTFLTFMA